MPEVLLATDADWIREEVEAALVDDDTSVVRVSAGRDVLPAVEEHDPDLVVLDLQIGNMGGMATCLSLRLEEGAGRLERRPVLMLLDRPQDVFLGRRSDAEGWLIKPLDAFRLRRAATALLAGDTWTEGVVEDTPPAAEPMVPPPEAAEPVPAD
jgi:DNA-binding response OmpR family regulator